MDHGSLTHLKVRELVEECRKLGLRTQGKKAELVQRIVEHHNSSLQISKRSRENSIKNESNTKKQKTMTTNGKSNMDGWTVELQELFTAYEDPEIENCITDDGILLLCEHLEIDFQDPVMLALSYHMDAATMGEFTKEEFIRGFKALKCHSIADLKGKTEFLREQLSEKSVFAKIYAYSFNFAKEVDQKSMAVDSAIQLWELLLPGHFKLLPAWLEFIKTHQKNAISRDVWMQTLEFASQVSPDLTDYDENGAWPVIIDDFVAHVKSSGH